MHKRFLEIVKTACWDYSMDLFRNGCFGSEVKGVLVWILIVFWFRSYSCFDSNLTDICSSDQEVFHSDPAGVLM